MNKDVNVPAVIINAQGELVINASPTSSKHDFDFFVGKWNIHNKKLKSRLSQCTEWEEFESTQEMYLVLNGLGNIDNFLATVKSQAFEGMTVRLFNPITKLWSIYWADSNNGILDPPVIGSFNNRIGYFFTKDIVHSKSILVLFRWDARDQNNPIWSQAFSEDDGKNWEWNWYMYMSKL
ncbi:hypothetical protein [Fibrella aquatilis]|uniref:DUF1579 domain-containing protein n=1 Tax=Fibrella aquatilis TaxID=2817059 RepID=A0A939G5R2_9BACT|nr:hypothetical protein [Fibrella aquatilis]MBO0930915.1 hypothetical protein [Fibrella aquatilis]